MYREYYTYQDYRNWKGDWELIEGMPFPLPPLSSIKDQVLIFRLIHLLRERIKGFSVFSEVQWVVRTDTVLVPSLLVVEGEVEPPITIPPTIVFELVSPILYRRVESYKFELYRREGVKFYGLIYPPVRKIKIYDFRGQLPRLLFDGTFGEVRIPLSNEYEVTLTVEEVFEEL